MNCARQIVVMVASSVMACAAVASGGAVEGSAAAIKPTRVLLLDLTRNGSRLIAVGERGVIMSKATGEQSWSIQRAATTRTLVAVAFANEKLGVAVGHGGALLRTDDGGLTWDKVAVGDAGSDSLLGVTALGGQRFAAYGAFGLYLESDDGGESWVRQSIALRAAAGDGAPGASGKEGAGEEVFDRHIMKVVRTAMGLWLVGESGTLARSVDDGRSWVRVASPYQGSFSGVLESPLGVMLIYGMRGNVFRSTDDGATWAHIELNTKSAINGGAELSDGRIVLVGNDGLVAVSEDGGRSFKNHVACEGRHIAQVAQEANGGLVVVGAGGARVLDVSGNKSEVGSLK